MPADRIEREIDIDAPIDVVWTVITEPEHITGWFTDSVELDVRPGGEGRFGWDVKATSREMVVNLRVERLEPPTSSPSAGTTPTATSPPRQMRRSSSSASRTEAARRACASSKAAWKRSLAPTRRRRRTSPSMRAAGHGSPNVSATMQ